MLKISIHERKRDVFYRKILHSALFYGKILREDKLYERTFGGDYVQDISQERQRIFQLNQQRWSMLESCMKPGKLLTASFYERYTKCGNPNCKCAAGELHGPFPWIYQKRKGGKLISTSCNEGKVEDARKFSENYKALRAMREQIREINEEIEILLQSIETINTVDANEFTRKDGERRGRKSKESTKSAEGKDN
jgi:hypothetical protein